MKFGSCSSPIIDASYLSSYISSTHSIISLLWIVRKNIIHEHASQLLVNLCLIQVGLYNFEI